MSAGCRTPVTRGGGLVAAAALLACCAVSGQSLENEPREEIHAFAGDAVILPCSIPVTGDLPTVEWSKEGLDPNITFLYRHGCETFEMKNSVFQYRTNLIMSELKDGNISLRISNVRLTDAGKYQCTVVRERRRHVVKTVELVVGAASEPKVSVDPGAGGGVTLQCKADCWFPEPEVTFVDDQGQTISADDPKTAYDLRGCFSVTRRATLHTAPSRITCRVQEPQMNNTRVKEINYIPGDCRTSCIITGVLVTILSTCAFIFNKYREHVGKKMCGRLSVQSTGLRFTAVQQRNQDDDNENAAAEPQRRNGELEKQLRDKDKRIQQLTEELSHLGRRWSPVVQHGQSTISNSPSTSSRSSNQPLQPPRGNNTEPPASASSNHTKFETILRKHLKPGVQRQDPATGLLAKTSSRSTSSPALFTNNGTYAYGSFSSSTSEKKCPTRTRSQSHPGHGGATPRASCRNTISVSPYVSYNPFSPLEKLNEESEGLLSSEET